MVNCYGINHRVNSCIPGAREFLRKTSIFVCEVLIPLFDCNHGVLIVLISPVWRPTLGYHTCVQLWVTCSMIADLCLSESVTTHETKSVREITYHQAIL